MTLWVAWASILTAVWGIFQATEKTVKPATKKLVGEWLKRVGSKSTAQTVLESPHWFIQAFNNIFGEKHWTWRCFWRSCVASIIAVVVMTFIWAATNSDSWYSCITSPEGIRIIIPVCVALNFIPDYISLIETRWILSRAARGRLKGLIMLLVLDVVITGAIILIPFVIIAVIVYPTWQEGLQFLVSIVQQGIRLQWTWPGLVTPGIFLYSTYFTSVWFYLFLLSSIIIRIAFLGRIGNKLMAVLDVEEKPFQSMGIIAMGLTTIVFALIAIVSAII